MTLHRSSSALAVLIAIAAMLSACTNSPGGHAEGSRDATPPVVVAVRRVCALAGDNPDAAIVQVRGFDGATSVVTQGRDYWFFGDTLRAGPGGVTDVIPAAVATSDDFDGHDCVRLEFKSVDGTAEPLFPRLDETTSWPDGTVALDDGSMAFYMVRTYRTSPFAWHVGAIGLGRIAGGTTDGVREVETIWDEDSGFGTRIVGARSPVRVGDDVYVYLHTERNDNLIAKAPVSQLADPAAYRYWDGSGWSKRPQDAQPIWPSEDGVLPADNGVSVTYDERIAAWVAIYNAGMLRVEARVAEHPWGPWSSPVTWFDCKPLVEDVYPYCYSAEPHRELSQDGKTLYLTFSSQRPYDVTLLELRFGVAIHAWRRDDGDLRYAATAPTATYTDDGVAFYASDAPAEGLAPIYTQRDGTYGLDPPSTSTAPAFYAYRAHPDGPLRVAPVYRWHRDEQEALDSRTREGWQRGEIAFYALCTGGAAEESSC